MDEIIDGLFISSLELANNIDLLRSNCIDFVISIGCQLRHDISTQIPNLSFPEVLDTTDSLVIDVGYVCSMIIAYNMRGDVKNRTLVHCVYGQSRSATIICFYLINAIHSNTSHYPFATIDDMISYVRDKHHDICINPGFLAQLYLIFSRGTFHVPEYELLRYMKSPRVYSIKADARFPFDISSMMQSKVVSNLIPQRRIVCKHCKAMFASYPADIVIDDITYQQLLDKLIDPYWRYSPTLDQRIYATPSTKNQVILSPGANIFNHLKLDPTSFEGIVFCYQCSKEVGFWKKDGLALCANFVPAFLMALHFSSIVSKRC